MKPVLRKLLVYLLVFELSAPSLAPAASVQIPGIYGPSVNSPARNALPVVRNVVQGATVPAADTLQNKLTIYQNQPKAIIEWNSFDIGADAWTHFDQQGNTGWVALNRIYDQNPSLIFGRLTADGKIYLINQNGILFGRGSRVNVSTMIASALNLTFDLDDIYNGSGSNSRKTLKFARQDYMGTGLNPLAAVSNHGEIRSDSSGGELFLIAPYVENAGLMSAPAGQAGLIAGATVDLVHTNAADTDRTGYYVLINKDDFINPADPRLGTAVNMQGGELRADGGVAGMYGNNVEQNGTIRSITAYLNKRGMVELRAANKVTTGAGSAILLPVDASIDPETHELVTVDDTFDIQPQVFITGLQRMNSSFTTVLDSMANSIEHAGFIQASTGNVTMSAVDRIYLETDSSIDVGGVRRIVYLEDGSRVAVNTYRDEDINASRGVTAVELPAPILADIKLSSVELRDFYMQKGGILQGSSISTDLVSGSAIGAISQIILNRPRSALERSIGGARRTTIDSTTGDVTYDNAQTGAINLKTKGDLVVKQGAVLDFSGGGIHFTGSPYWATYLVSGDKVYSIAAASPDLRYDRLLSLYTNVGSYTVGGDAGALNLNAARLVMDGTLHGGATSGTYQNTWTMPGTYGGQNTAYGMAMSLSVRRGLETPRSGTLSINMGDDTAGVEGMGVIRDRRSSIEIVSRKTSTDIQFETPLSEDSAGNFTAVLSAESLNAARLGTLNLSANLAVSTSQDAAIRLQPGGGFAATARRISHEGSITVPGGTIGLTIAENSTSARFYDLSTGTVRDGLNIALPGSQEINLGRYSVLDAAGEIIDNSLSGATRTAALRTGQTTGGQISIMDKTDAGSGVTINSGAIVNVSGGYSIDKTGKATGGNAGLLEIQGSNIALDGDLRGYALSSTNGKTLGGSVTLRAKNIRVAPEAYDLADTLVLAGDRFDDTGFTQIALYSYSDVIFDPDTTMKTSLVRLANPSTGTLGFSGISSLIGEAVSGRPGLMRLKDASAFMAGPSSITAVAAQDFAGKEEGYTGHLKGIAAGNDSKVLVSRGVVIRTAPAVPGVARIAADVVTPAAVKTGIMLRGPNLEIRGTLESRGGDIVASTMPDIGKDLTVTADARIIAAGYNRPDPDATPKNYPTNYLPAAGGNVTLSAFGSLTLAEGSLVDISGSEVVENRVLNSGGTAYLFLEAGDPGSLTLSFGKDLQSSGDIKVKNPAVNIGGVRGGALTLRKVENTAATSASLDVGTGAGEADLGRYVGLGFDDITLKGYSSIRFNGAVSEQIGRKLTLDAPVISGTGPDVALSAPWIVLANSTAPAANIPGDASGGTFKLSSEKGWIDVIGSVGIGGFRDVILQAGRDMRLSEALYFVGGADLTSGNLAVKGDLTLDAGRIYPGGFYSYKSQDANDYSGTYSDFTVHSDRKVTIQGPARRATDPIYSAGGKLTIEGNEGIEIKQGGFLAAPLGQIELKAPGRRIYIADGGTLTTVGARTADGKDLEVRYGFIDEGNNWMIADDKISYHISSETLVGSDSLPPKGITLNADSVIVRSGAEIDASGGGSVFAYKFQAGVAGSTDPLTKANRYIVFRNNSFPLPGTEVHLNGGGGLSAGTYTLVPLNAANAKYAFLPDAYIIEAQKSTSLPGANSLSQDGYPLTIGFLSVAGTSVLGSRPQVYSVRKASELLGREGDYIRPALSAGDAGNISIAGRTTILEGQLKGAAVNGYTGGTANLSAANVIVRQTVERLLPDNFDFSDVLSPDYENKLILSAGSLSGMGFRSIGLGDVNATSTVTIESGTPETPTTLNAAVISLAARDEINIQANTRLNALTEKESDSGEGVINLTTPGKLTIGPDALAHATHDIILDVNNVDGIQGGLQTDSSSITLKNESVFFFDRGASTARGLYVSGDVLSRFSGYENITFMGRDLQFKGDMALSAAGRLTLDAAAILDMKTDGPSLVTLTAPIVNIRNSAGATSTSTAPADGKERGTFTVNAADRINIGGGNVFFDGFREVNLSSVNDLTLKGSGSLATGNPNVPAATRSYADLNITAARVVTGSDSNGTRKFIAPNFTVDAGTAAVRMNGSPGVLPAATMAPGGLLEIMARRIELGTVLQSNGGTLKLTTKGVTGMSDDGIFLTADGRILAQGTDDAPGGRVYLATDYINGAGTETSGQIVLAAGSLITVDAGGQGDAGLISLSAPAGGVDISGTLSGQAGVKYQPSTSFAAALTGNAAPESLEVAADRNIIGFTYNGTDYRATVEVEAGAESELYASGADLAAALQAALNSAVDPGNNAIQGNPFTVSYSDDSGKLTITNGNSYFAVTNFLATAANTLPASRLGFGPVNGAGGSLALDTYQVSNADPFRTNTDWTRLIGAVAAGKFTGALDIRARRGNVELAGGQSLQARSVKLTADDSTPGSGSINISGTINAATPDGSGFVELYARDSVNVNSGGVINARGTAVGAKGGDVVLSATDGNVNLNSGSSVDVSAGPTGRGGTVYLRAQRTTETSGDVKINLAAVTLAGASAVFAEAFWSYTGSTFDAAWLSSAADYYSHSSDAAGAVTRLEGRAPDGAATFHLLPGIEWKNSSGDLAINSLIDLTSGPGKRFQTDHDIAVGKGSEPGVLTILSTGNLTINQNIVDHPTAMDSLRSSPVRDSWGINLVAGADLSSADYLATVKGTNAAGNPAGNLTIANNVLVYTESAPLRFASAGDTTIGSGTNPGYMINTVMKYNLASYDGSIVGNVGRDLIINGGAVQTATGDITINAGRDIQLNKYNSLLGSIRTTGETRATADVETYTYETSGSARTIYEPLDQYWTYAGGGDINVSAGRAIGRSGPIMDWDNAWIYFSPWRDRSDALRRNLCYGIFSADYGVGSYADRVTAGIAAMGGGDIRVRTGGDFLAQAGTFGEGDLAVYAGGDAKGRFLSRSGRGEVQAGGNFGSANDRIQIELFSSDFKVAAAGEIQVGAIVNPNLASSENPYYTNPGSPYVWGTICTYTPDTRVSLKAGTDVTVAGKSPYYVNHDSLKPTETVLPATVDIEAGGNIHLLNSLTLASSPLGNLRLNARTGDISGLDANGNNLSHVIMMSDIAPEYWYGAFPSYTGANESPTIWIENRTATDSKIGYYHGYYKDSGRQRTARALHYNDPRAIQVNAGRDVAYLNMFFPKRAEVTAQRDIASILYEGQNLRPEDVSMLRAMGDIRMQYVGNVNSLRDKGSDRSKDPLVGLIQGGPGVFLVQAGSSIELGVLTDGIQAIGNGRYPQLGTESSRLAIVSGYRFEKTADDIGTFFAALQRAGDDYAQLMAQGSLAEAAGLLDTTRATLIYPFLGEPSGRGDVNMSSSQIATSIGESDIFVIAAGDLNLGKTALADPGKIPPKTGVTTGGGGAVNMFSIGDVNVNESRVMTFYGGDITVWSDQGSINAGRGSRTAVSASPPKVNEDGTRTFSPPAIGSGIRAVTYGDNAPEPGNIHLFAPSGIIDAGEAGISGSNIVLAATKILNKANISFSFGAIGMPVATASTTNIGSLSGASAFMEKGQVSAMMSSSGASRALQASEMLETILAKWVDVKVVDYIEEEE